MRVKRVLKLVLNRLFRTPIEQICVVILAVSILSAIATLVEPARSLRFRRGVGPWKIVTYLCSKALVQVLADTVYSVSKVPTVAVMIKFTQLMMTWLFFPVVAFMSAVSDPAVVRSIIILVGLPSMFMALCCRVHMISKKPGLSTLVTWMLVAILCALGSVRFPSLLVSAVSDVSLTVYLVLLAAALALAAVQERLAVEKHGRKQCREHAALCAVYVLAVVVGMWIIRAADSRLVAFDVLRDVKHMFTGHLG